MNITKSTIIGVVCDHPDYQILKKSSMINFVMGLQKLKLTIDVC